MNTDVFDFELPDEQIAAAPLSRRDSSRMLVVDRAKGTFADTDFSSVIERLSKTDILVLNDTKVFPARLFGRTETEARVEVFLVGEAGGRKWEVLARPAKRLRPGKTIDFSGMLSATIIERAENGKVLLEFAETERGFFDIVEEIGRTPLPPYIKRKLDSPDTDRERYQTVYAKNRGAIAAPTAGLHFTPELIDAIREKGVTVANITLHVGYGTFEPIRVEDISEHKVLPERYFIPEETAQILNNAQAEGRRIVAVGTTTTRALESAAAEGTFRAGDGIAELTITPGYEFRAVGALLTNFHLPKSSLLVLVSSFAGRDLIMEAYEHAVAAGYRFYSYGDCMFIK